MKRVFSMVLTAATILCLSAYASGEEKPDPALADRIIDKMENLMRGKASVGEMEMFIKRWDRTMRMKFWELYPDNSLVRITAPAEDAGMGSLKLGDDLWSYNPKIDQVQKIPPSLMLDSWMGSDFTNDDVSRGSSVKLDYDTGKVTAGRLEDVKTWRVPLKPRPDSPVVWDRLVVEVAQDDYRPLRQEYYDEKGKLARRMIFGDYRKMDDQRNYPYLWRMENLQEKGRITEIRVLQMEFKDSLPKRRFSIRALKRAR